MATVWKFEYNDGSPQTIEFDRAECEKRITRTNCAMDVQTFKNGLSRIYNGPAEWDSFKLTFRHDGQGTIAKVNQLAAVQVDVKFYYRKHRDDSYKYVNVVPDKTRKYVAGGLSVDPVRLDLVETNTP